METGRLAASNLHGLPCTALLSRSRISAARRRAEVMLPPARPAHFDGDDRNRDRRLSPLESCSPSDDTPRRLHRLLPDSLPSAAVRASRRPDGRGLLLLRGRARALLEP